MLVLLVIIRTILHVIWITLLIPALEIKLGVKLLDVNIWNELFTSFLWLSFFIDWKKFGVWLKTAHFDAENRVVETLDLTSDIHTICTHFLNPNFPILRLISLPFILIIPSNLIHPHDLLILFFKIMLHLFHNYQIFL